MSEWIKFDGEEESTWPAFGEPCITFITLRNGNTIQSIHEFEFEHDGGRLGFDRVCGIVTHWQPLPEPPTN